ncbi:MAG: ASKHA domain-containing protein [Anaerolineales bacterium]|nr:ASKHA domain-containing protein [Anaerolineales bacterium]MDP2975350.1 ASKHA domain-containing protein [Anaerolineales bacterium]
MEHTVTFQIAETGASATAKVPTGSLLVEALQKASVDISQPCGGQGRCGRCIVQVTEGNIRRRSALRLSAEDIAEGYALACQSVVEGDLQVFVPPQEKIARRMTSDRTAAEVRVPENYDFRWSQTIRRIPLRLNPPSMDDQTDDWGRLQTALRTQASISPLDCSVSLLRRIGGILREAEWEVTAIVDLETGEAGAEGQAGRLIDVRPGLGSDDDPLYAAAIDIGTTTVTFWLVDLVTGQVRAQAAEYNSQIARGEDVVSRIVYASKDGGGEEMQSRVVETINALAETACKRVKISASEVVKAALVGNSTMIHLLLGVPAASIRLSPFITAVNHPPLITAREIGLTINPEATVDCLPGVASYVGADITAGVLSSGVDQTGDITLFLDVGTNGEMVLGNRDWLVTCACSAGPAFEGAGVVNGMRAMEGAIEEVWINGETFEPTYRVIGGSKPRGVCGSGLISLLAETFLTGVLDKAGNVNTSLKTRRVREGEHGGEYVLAWGAETEHGEDIVISRVDVDNLLRAKAAIYAGYTVLAEQVGVSLADVHKMLIGGSFGKYINVEKAVQIGLLPDMPWERFEFLGNTAVRGAYYALLDWQARDRVAEIARRMTYIELSADNTFYDAFMSAMFLPHTDMSRFPTVEAALRKT